jgi:hypothetical protein
VLDLIAIVAGWALAFSPQMAIWSALYGAPLALPQGPSFLQWSSPHPFLVLFSDNHGLFTWAPLLLLSLVGLVKFGWKHRTVGIPIAIVTAVAWYVNAAVVDWWAGEAFGARRFLSLYPLFVLGLASWLSSSDHRLRPGRVGLVALLTIANGLLLFQYQLFMKGAVALAPYPHGVFDMYFVRFVVPWRILGW